MFARVKSLGISGIGGYGVTVEVDISSGLPAFDIVVCIVIIIQKLPEDIIGDTGTDSHEDISGVKMGSFLFQKCLYLPRFQLSAVDEARAQERQRQHERRDQGRSLSMFFHRQHLLLS